MPEPLLREPIEFKAKPRKRRKLDERIWAALPWLVPRTTAAILRLPPNSRIRRSMIRYWVHRSYEIVNRRDFELAFAAQDPEAVISWSEEGSGTLPPDLVGREFSGDDGFRRAWDAWLDAFEDLRVEPTEVTDLDDRLLIGIHSVGHGSFSGVEVDMHGFTLFTFRGGRVLRQEFFVDRELAERTAGMIE
jgi:ketosteroid isomerase-like protein